MDEYENREVNGEAAEVSSECAETIGEGAENGSAFVEDGAETETKYMNEAPQEHIQEQKGKEDSGSGTAFAYDIASIFATAIIAIMVVFTFVFRFVGVDGTSMVPTLHDGDWLAVSACSSDPVSGDVVIVTQPNYFNEPIVKRVIAVENQTIDLIDGYVYVDGNKLNEPYLDATVRTWEEDTNFPITVEKGHVFVMGDNRGGSTDSRSTKVGQIDTNYILGKVKVRLIPVGQWTVE